MTPKEIYDEYLDNMKTRYEINYIKCYDCKWGTIEPSYQSSFSEADEQIDSVYCFKMEGWVGNIEDCDNYEYIPKFKKQILSDNPIDN